MKCEEVFREISNYLDGDLSVELRREFEIHVKSCHHCEVVYDTTRQTIELYCDGELFPLPVEVRERLHVVLRRRYQEMGF